MFMRPHEAAEAAEANKYKNLQKYVADAIDAAIADGRRRVMVFASKTSEMNVPEEKMHIIATLRNLGYGVNWVSGHCGDESGYYNITF